MKNTTEAYFRQRLIRYAEKKGVTEASIRYHISRKTVYKWLKRYDGTLLSLEDRSHRPQSNPRAHSEAEKELIQKKLKRRGWRDLILIYQELVEKHGYTRSYGGFKRVARRLRKEPIKIRRKHKPKPYQKAEYPGQKVQMDVKFVPASCTVDGKKYYEFIAVDEYSRWAFRRMYDEKSTYSAKDFLKRFLEAFPYRVKRIQTDNGTEFTKQLLVNDPNDLTLFEQELKERGVEYQRIRVATPRTTAR